MVSRVERLDPEMVGYQMMLSLFVDVFDGGMRFVWAVSNL